ncbi:TRAF3-interacting protein 1 [Drosophila busckii]|nr:TRAF3-interacting protein 1 [Drosophila busckii]
MSDEVDAAIIKATQDSLGKFIKKPPLTEKLLKKPPFRFLLDIFNEFIKQTGCFEGLYAPEEQLFENIADRHDKTQFLQKMIDVTKLTTKRELKVRTSKIVAGHEPQLTNELLQAMASVAEQGLDWRSVVDSYENKAKPKAKEAKPKENKSSPNSQVTAAASRKDKRVSPQEQKLRKATEQAARSPPVPGKEKTQRRQKTSTEAEAKPKLSKQGSKHKTPSPTKPAGKPKPQTSTESEAMSPAPVKQVTPEAPAKHSAEARRSPKANTEHSLETTAASSVVAAPNLNVEPESRKSSSKSRRSSAKREAAPEPQSIETPSPASEANNNPPVQPQPDSNNNSNNSNMEIKRQRENTFTRESSRDSNNSVTRPRTSLRPPSARPASARPGAPRRRNVEIVLQPNDQLKMSGINVKLETFGDFDDDGENLVIIEDANAHDIESGGGAETQLDADQPNQGRLVQQILETQKELVQPSSEPSKEEQQPQLRQSSARQMNDLRDVIQSLTKSVNPLGKLMDFIPEDIDAMQLELTMWRDTYTQAYAELKREQSLTASATEPMKQQLLAIEASIEEYKELIDESRHKILQNNERILKMLMEQ